jgi:hypothetical protein
MHAFLSLAQALALALGQGEPADPPPEPPAAQEPAAPAADAEGEAVAAPPAAPPRRPRPAAPQEDGATGVQQPQPPPPPAQPARPSEPERAQVARAALAFLDALLAGDATAIAGASSERFSFGGDVRAGREELKRAWRAILADRDPAQRGALLDLELLTGPDAIARLGPPPQRLAPLASAKGVWVAVANVSRRPVILFLVREGGRFAVVGME